jgi:nicotinate phosphoribosyltransferase
LAAFISYGVAFPDAFLTLVDTYDTLTSGVPNFLCVALALHDLAYLSKQTRQMFIAIGERFQVEYFKHLNITASNDINEAVLNSLNEQEHSIDSFGIGTHLVTCQAQPALGMVYKLVEINGAPRIKLSEEIGKVTIPGRKQVYRMIGENGKALIDLMVGCDEKKPEINQKLLCLHPFEERRRVYVTPSKIIPLHELFWDGSKGGIVHDLPSLEQRRAYIKTQFELMREDIIRPLNATPYKVSVSTELYNFIHELWMAEVPVQELI